MLGLSQHGDVHEGPHMSQTLQEKLDKVAKELDPILAELLDEIAGE
jgi:hypothetical protein